MYVCMSCCSFKSILLFCLSMELSHFLAVISTWHSTKCCSSIFDLGPYLQLHKIAYKLACMTDRPEMFAPTTGFWGMADSMEPYKML